MKRPRAELFARAAFALEQHRGVGAGGAFDGHHHLAQGRGFADDARAAAAGGGFLFEQPVFTEHALLLERARHQQQQVIGIDGLGEEVERAVLHGLDGVLDAAVGRHHDDRQFRIQILGGAQHAHAVAFGQAQIGEHERRLRIPQRGGGFFLIAGFDDAIVL